MKRVSFYALYLLVYSILSVMQCVLANIYRYEMLVRIGAWRWHAVFKEHVEDKLLVSYAGVECWGFVTVFRYCIVCRNTPKFCVITCFFFPCNGGLVI